MHSSVYHSHAIQAWEQRWFQQQNNHFGLMQQAAWTIAQRLILLFEQKKITHIALCCGFGNNAGDGYLIATYLAQANFQVEIYATDLGQSANLKCAYEYVKKENIQINWHFNFKQHHQVYIDALFGIGLNRELDENFQNIIQALNEKTALKISIDIPSGLHADTGQTLPCAFVADYTYTVLAHKLGLHTGKAKAYVGQIELCPLIPTDNLLKPTAYLASKKVVLPPRSPFSHKGTHGHVFVIGGHANMGGAVMMAAEAAFYAGAGKVTVICHKNHHVAILSRMPNIMVQDIDQLDINAKKQLLAQADAIAFGMGLGRDLWAKNQFLAWFDLLQQNNIETVLDADALWFLAEHDVVLAQHFYLTPHPAEAAKLLAVTVAQVEQDRIASIGQLKEKYQGQWVLKGSGSLILEQKLWICQLGNAGMATGGMGDVLAGMIASLKAQFKDQVALHDIVTLHAQAGDLLAKTGMRGVQAHHMNEMIYQVVNQTD